MTRHDGEESEGREGSTREEREGACASCCHSLSSLLGIATLIAIVPFMGIVTYKASEEELVKQNMN